MKSRKEQARVECGESVSVKPKLVGICGQSNMTQSFGTHEPLVCTCITISETEEKSEVVLTLAAA